mmetsp:Transcript_3656/g.5543  ORF Transcript_3656/g.5543 Transcript_3656/m.5543 type:complete len:127 (-) Transcript_3656:477-857(-)
MLPPGRVPVTETERKVLAESFAAVQVTQTPAEEEANWKRFFDEKGNQAFSPLGYNSSFSSKNNRLEQVWNRFGNCLENAESLFESLFCTHTHQHHRYHIYTNTHSHNYTRTPTDTQTHTHTHLSSF